MQQSYQEAADQLYQMLDEVLTKQRQELANEGLDMDKIPKQPMVVEIVSFLLVKCLTDERLAFDMFQQKQQANKEAMQIIKKAVIQYRGNNLVPPLRSQIH